MEVDLKIGSLLIKGEGDQEYRKALAHIQDRIQNPAAGQGEHLLLGHGVPGPGRAGKRAGQDGYGQRRNQNQAQGGLFRGFITADRHFHLRTETDKGWVGQTETKPMLRDCAEIT